jgi:hypothetical protein
MSFLDAIALEFARFAGQTVGYLLAALFYLIVVFLVWGLPWSRIIAKAGHKGKTYWTLLLLMFLPIAVGPLAGINTGLAEFCAAIAGISFYMVIWFLALFPWRQAKLKSDRP